MFNKNFYFETSAINYFYSSLTIGDAIATKAFQATKGNIFYMSPVSLWEIMLTSDDVTREKIIYFSQHFFNENLLKMPSEFIVNYIKGNCPLIETPYSIFTNLSFGEAWNDICNDKRKTLRFDKLDILNKTKFIRQIYRKLHSIINRITLDIYVNDDVSYNQQIIKPIYDKLVAHYGFFESDNRKIIKIGILFVYYLLCNCVELDSSVYDRFWMDIGIVKPVDRLWYMYNYHREIFMRGPFYIMAMMALVQVNSGQKSNRGLVLDCMHINYLTYLDVFATNDIHFKNFSEYYLHLNVPKILYLNDTKIIEREVTIIRDR